ncbi:hypothetical protein O9992_26165 [Vibrio lentus]|nr:hypothetical protein [Vibrio lentus]
MNHYSVTIVDVLVTMITLLVIHRSSASSTHSVDVAKPQGCNNHGDQATEQPQIALKQLPRSVGETTLLIPKLTCANNISPK